MKKIQVTENGIQLAITKNIAFCNKQKHGVDFDLDGARRHCQEYAKSIIETYVDTLIGTLRRRMNACTLHLQIHLDDIEYADNCGHIVWRRNDDTCGQFNVKSYEAMESAIEALKCGCFGEFLEQPAWIDQTLKALLNDPVDNHKDFKEHKYSELVSLLCEAHVAAYQPIPFK